MAQSLWWYKQQYKQVTRLSVRKEVLCPPLCWEDEGVM